MAKRTETNKEKTLKLWNDISGKMTLYAKDFETETGVYTAFSTSVGKKIENKWINSYFNVYFKKDCQPNLIDRFEINVKSGFITTILNGDYVKPCIIITDYEIINEG